MRTAHTLKDLARRCVTVTFDQDGTVSFDYRSGKYRPTLVRTDQEMVAIGHTHAANVYLLTELPSARSIARAKATASDQPQPM